MCSNSGVCDSLHAAIIDEGKTKNCVSCKQPSEFVVRKVNGYCQPCYLEACRHKFRSTVGKTKLMKPGDRVLVWLNSPLGAAAARHLLDEGEREREVSSKKKLQFEFTYATLDGHDGPTALDGEVLRIPYTEPDSVQRNTTLKLSNDSLASQKCVIDFAKAHNYTKVFTCDTGSDLAHLMLTSISLGRGGQLPDWTGVSVEHGGLILLRPLREFTEEELMQYLRLNGIEIPPKKKPVSSIQRLSLDFVEGLQADFPSTVPTIWRTADKITADLSSLPSKCDYCGCHNSTDTVGAMDALEVSTELSTTLQLEKLIATRCHACRQIFIK